MIWTRIFTTIQSRCYCSVTALEPLKKSAAKVHNRHLIVDKVRIRVRGGTGGQGSAKGGGVGGNGGSVFIKCAEGSSLTQYNLKHNKDIIAGHGEHIVRNKLKANKGKDVYITVPAGTEIRSNSRNKNELLYDMNHIGDVIKIARGGVGGSSKTRAFHGEIGERKPLILEMKTIADASLTGFPNAGKSSLLRGLSRAMPKIGSYPFTTINPMVGSIFYSDDTQIKVADLPGLIEDAHINKGMGHKFLRHIERTRLVVLIIDINGFQLKSDQPYRSPLETIILLLKELALYKEVILSRPFLLVFNKMDCEDSDIKYDQVLNELQRFNTKHHLLQDFEYADVILEQVKQFCQDDFSNVLKVSALNGSGINTLKLSLHSLLSSQT